ncbi:MAG: YibE/F family protein [bacterium]
MKNILLTILLFIIILPGICYADNFEPPKPIYAKAKVLEVITHNNAYSEASMKSAIQEVTIKILNSKFKGQTATVEHMTSCMMGGEMVLKKGDKVIVYIDENPSPAESPDGSPVINVADYARVSPIYWLAFFYALLLIIVGGMKGFKSLISLIITIGLIFFILFPLTLWGFNPLLVSILISGLVSLIVFWIIGGKSTKSISASAGTLLGVSIAGILAFIVGNMMHLSGMSSEESRILLYSMNLQINYQGLLFGSILIGALGAIMDIGMSIASSVDEIHKVHPESNFENLFKAGMNVGKDVMGTMSNTLILAYTGSSLPLLLLLIANNMSIDKIMNMEIIAVEAVRALSGSIGLVMCIPITAFVSAWLNSQIIKGK